MKLKIFDFIKQNNEHIPVNKLTLKFHNDKYN